MTDGSAQGESSKDTKQDDSSTNGGNPPPAAGERFCKDCGEIISQDAEICPECGVRQQTSDKNQNIEVSVDNKNQSAQSQNAQQNGQLTGNKSKTLATILAIFLGTFGIHKFYLGQAARGIIFALFFWTGIPTIVGLIQGISYLLMSEQRFAQKFG